MYTIFFTHIPKTAGTTLHKTVFEPNIKKESIRSPKGVWSLLTNRESFRYMHGHFPYGYHRLASASGEPLYFVVLRDPVERAISYYYNILYPRGKNETPIHPEYETARDNTLDSFYEIPRFQNLQTRIVAGFPLNRLGRYINLNNTIIGRKMVDMAKHNLKNNYEALGFTEKFEETAEMFSSRLGFSRQNTNKKYKVVPNRPTKEDVDPNTLSLLRKKNSLDIKMYNYAKSLGKIK